MNTLDCPGPPQSSAEARRGTDPSAGEPRKVRRPGVGCVRRLRGGGCEIGGGELRYEWSHFTENDVPSELRLLGVAIFVPVLLAIVISLALNAESEPVFPTVSISDDPL